VIQPRSVLFTAAPVSPGFLEQRRYLLHDRDTKFCPLFRATLKVGGIKPIQLPARSPNLNGYGICRNDGDLGFEIVTIYAKDPTGTVPAPPFPR
jgi:hypothetical protein